MVCFEGPRVHLQDRRSQYGANTVEAEEHGRLWKNGSDPSCAQVESGVFLVQMLKKNFVHVFCFHFRHLFEGGESIFRLEPLFTSNSCCLFHSKGGRCGKNSIMSCSLANVGMCILTWIMLITLRIFGFERPLFVRNGPKHEVSAQISRQPWVTVETIAFRMCTSERSMACRRVERTGTTSNRG